MFELAKRNNVSLPYESVQEVKNAFNFHNLQSFLDVYYLATAVIINEIDFYDLTYAYFTKIHPENVCHIEMFFDPQAHTERGIAFETIITGITRAMQDAEKNYKITSKLIMCILRHLDQEKALSLLDEARPFKHKIFGVGLDSGEKGNPPEKFMQAFQKAGEDGYRLVAHAGEEGKPENIWSAIDKLKVERVDHGVACLYDEKLIEELIARKMPLTVCPLSNVKLCVFKELNEFPYKD